MSLQEELNSLNEEQRESYDKFGEFIKSDLQTAVLMGLGGTGKTYSIGITFKGYSFYPDAVLAPTNEAVNVLEKRFQELGLDFITCATIHSILGLVPTTPKWESSDAKNLKELETKLDELAEDDEEYKETRKEVWKLDYRRKKAKKNDPIFSVKLDKDTEPEEEGKKLEDWVVVVDECSMIPDDLYHLLISTFKKIIFMGDPNQCFPVQEGKKRLSMSFDADMVLGDFKTIRRASGAIPKLCKDIVDSKNIDIGYRLATSAPAWDGKIYRDKDESSYVCTIGGNDAKTLIDEWVLGTEYHALDGSEFRMINYKNETSLGANRYIKQGLLKENWEIDDLLIANSPVYRYVKGKNYRMLRTSAKTHINDILHFDVAEIPMGGGKIEEIEVVKASIFTDDKAWKVESYWDKGIGAGTGGYVHVEPNEGLVNLISFKDQMKHKKCMEFWTLCRSAFYTKTKDNKSKSSEALFSLLGCKSWNEIYGTPGRKRFTHKNLSNLNLDFLKPFVRNKFGEELPENYDQLCKMFNRAFFWVKELDDGLRMRTATTVHKAQGSGIMKVIVNTPEIYEARKYGDGGREDALRLLNTALGRARKELYIIK